MPRLLTDAMKTQVAAKRLRPCLFFEGQFMSGPLRMWTGSGNVDWNGHTWCGSQKGSSDQYAPMLMSISSMGETSAQAASGITVGLSGIPSSFVDPESGATRSIPELILQECRQSYAITIWIGSLDLDTGDLIVDPAIAWSGRIDQPQLADDGNTCSATLTIETRFIDLQRPRERRWTHEDQQVDHPGDLGFEYVTQLQQLDISWGKSSSRPPGPRTGGPAGPVRVPVSP